MEYRQRVQAIIIQNNRVLFGSRIVNDKEYRHFFIGGELQISMLTLLKVTIKKGDRCFV